jgi:hypothetical protein
MNFLKKIMNAIALFFADGKAQKALEAVASLVPKALPIIDIAAVVVTTLTPTGIDDVTWAAIKAKFPALFDGSLKTGDDVKLYALGVATEMLKAKFPGVSTSIARAAVQLAYTGKTA